MRVHQFFDMSRKPPVGELPDVPGNDARRERTMQRLQIGITGWRSLSFASVIYLEKQRLERVKKTLSDSIKSIRHF